MHKVKYSFKRTEGIAGFFSSNRASTDALNALQTWLNGNRSYEVVIDEDELLVAILEFEKNDEAAGLDLDKACDEHGVFRKFEEKIEND
ncbi:MAG: hypothetical protein V3T17_03505 [Pseudomonadales bacterium]